MQSINTEQFELCFNQLMAWSYEEIRNYSNTEVSFRTGPWFEEEGYKRQVWEKAREILSIKNWQELSDKEIIDRLIKALSEPDTDQNFVSLANIQEVGYLFYVNAEKVAQIMRDLFLYDQNQKAFEQLQKILQNKVYDEWSVISFFFFLKDRNKYVTIRKEGTQVRLGQLGITDRIFSKCTWNNYIKYLNLIEQLQIMLQQKLPDHIELVDAQSFLWLLHHINGRNWKNQDIPQITSQDSLETIVVSSAANRIEGRKVQYYTTKYERSAKNRMDAIRAHGCKCMVCEFDFEKVYGELGSGFIEVHHSIPLASRDEEVEVNPETDLVCLCANCHRMIHHKTNEILTIEDLKRILNPR